MNNEQFRRLVGSATPSGGQKNGAASTPAPAGGSALGSRMRSSIPMTPRSVAGGSNRNEFARQMAARDLANKPKKTFKTSAPKGSRLATGYTDRAREREAAEEDERAERIKALEELLKEEKIDQETFEKQRSAIAGGDLTSTHLVKGLDFKLLERVRRGEDVYGDKTNAPEEEEPSADVDDEFEALEEKEVQAVAKEAPQKKKGELAPLALIPGKKRTRDQIVAEMKAAREAAAKAAQEASLGDRFRKIGAKQKAGSRIERDSKGREVLIIIDEDGHEKRKVRKVQPEQEEAEREQMRPDENVAPLGMEVPEIYRKQQQVEEEEEDDDIFADAGDDYDPLAGISDSDDDDEKTDEQKADTKAMPPPPPPPKPARPQNYFEGSKSELLSAKVHKAPSMSDPSLQAAFQKAAQLGAKERTAEREADEDDVEAKKRAEKHRQMLESANRDDEDLDMGFGTSRFEDEEDFDEKKVKFSEWKGSKGGDDDDNGEGGSNGGKEKRKRGPKKRKGDANNAEDVLRVMAERKAKS
ncbi:hypothetical protein F5X68DRAFT_20007 [Plectosphaerella plurivora]|uniref:RED-like N-terminal domain-containing protein n=1 Tax=Plectosphaerella plurivora TaxID=936078 RepID=A0A9P8V9L1_9PEZI|nr:hypothetical protein F5X68DRAFT_20007 [Plectosphaerella plurivora]